MGLRFPADLDAWRRWQQAQHRLRAVKARLRPSPTPTLQLATRGDAPAEVLVVVESPSASSRLALFEPVAHLTAPTAVLAPFDPSRFLGQGWSVCPISPGQLPGAVTHGVRVLFVGDFLPLGAMVRQTLPRARLVVTQHGLLTPVAPPLPAGAHLLAWSQTDADFWRSGRSDISSTVVGSQLLFQAAAVPADSVSRFVEPVFLGQLHGAELRRSALTRISLDFCRRTPATYRPHPSETDKLSRLTHEAWRRLGVEIDDSGTPLAEVSRPVVGIYSTGVLEAAARGIPAWVHHPRPPAWLQEFWDRYAMSPWGGPPTASPDLPAIKPSRVVADWLSST
ncbi:MAG: prephenate dehydrogenase [Propionibacteriaceae bacterium]|nr:hypothetical protein [Micropruina sp.]HBX79703.1 hypothetical protein [Propionibacteriaceae bacterium]HBY21973.1 hypothetical protein [Propionibacteriaceae bacterium]